MDEKYYHNIGVEIARLLKKDNTNWIEAQEIAPNWVKHLEDTENYETLQGYKVNGVFKKDLL